jgi:catalase
MVEKLNRRQLIAGAGGLSMISAMVPTVDSAASASAGTGTKSANATERATEASAEAVVNALEGTYGVNRGQRRNHTKGVGAVGTFVGEREGAEYSRSPLFSGESLEVIARFSLAGGDPNASDLEKSPIKWDMIVTLGEPGDPETNPTLLWPKDRREFKAGTLTLTSAAPQTQAGSYQINYDPLLMSDGIAATDDPVLLFRSPTYALSFTRRIRNI